MRYLDTQKAVSRATGLSPNMAKIAQQRSAAIAAATAMSSISPASIMAKISQPHSAAIAAAMAMSSISPASIMAKISQQRSATIAAATALKAVGERETFIDVIKGMQLDMPELTLDVENEQITFKEQDYQVEEVSADMSFIAEEINSEENILQSLERLEQKIDSIKREPLYKDFLKQILYWFIFIICLGPIVQKYWLDRFAANKQQVVKQAKKYISMQGYDDDMQKNLRIVTAEEMVIRSCKNSRSRIVGVLYCGQIVEVTRKDRNWAQVELKDFKGNALIKGWVSNRYLKMISR